MPKFSRHFSLHGEQWVFSGCCLLCWRLQSLPSRESVSCVSGWWSISAGHRSISAAVKLLLTLLHIGWQFKVLDKSFLFFFLQKKDAIYLSIYACMYVQYGLFVTYIVFVNVTIVPLSEKKFEPFIPFCNVAYRAQTVMGRQNKTPTAYSTYQLLPVLFLSHSMFLYCNSQYFTLCVFYIPAVQRSFIIIIIYHHDKTLGLRPHTFTG